MYERQHGGDLEVGSYAHRPILIEPDDIPSIAEAALSPTELPFTQDDFDPQMEQALELVPDILGDERVGIRHAINGLIALTPDGNPILGETPEVKGLWSVSASWIKEAPGIAAHGRRVDDRREPGDRPARLRHRALLRPPQDRDARQGARGRGLQQDVRDRPPDGAVGLEPRRAPDADEPPPARARGGVLRGRRVGATDVVRVQRAAACRVRRSRRAARGRVGLALVVADHQRRAPRDARPGGDGRPVGVRDLRRERARAPSPTSKGWSSRRSTFRSAGSSTRRLLSEAGGIVADLTIMRLAHDRYPRRHRRRHGHARQEVVHRPPARGRLRAR